MALSKEQQQEIEEMINKRHDALTRELEGDVDKARAEQYSDIAEAPADPGDESNADLISDLATAELGRDLNELRELEAARERMRQGTFGVCIDCGQEIAFERLRIYPTVTRCFKCQQLYEKTFAHPGSPTL